MVSLNNEASPEPTFQIDTALPQVHNPTLRSAPTGEEMGDA